MGMDIIIQVLEIKLGFKKENAMTSLSWRYSGGTIVPL